MTFWPMLVESAVNALSFSTTAIMYHGYLAFVVSRSVWQVTSYDTHCRYLLHSVVDMLCAAAVKSRKRWPCALLRPCAVEAVSFEVCMIASFPIAFCDFWFTGLV